MSETDSNANTSTSAAADVAPSQSPTQSTTATPETHRLIEGKDMTYVIPRNQAGVPLVEYFGNAQLPDDLHKAMVFNTDNGPVLAKPDPVKWSQEHDVKAAEYATAVKTQIDSIGRYAPALKLYSGSLAKESGRSPEDARDRIVDHFQAKNGRTPREYLTDVRIQKGLPVNEWKQGQSRSQKQGQ